MRILRIDQYFGDCTKGERDAMEAWFDRNGVAWVGGRTVLEWRCGIILLGMKDRDWRHLANGEFVIATRPQSVISEEPFPWPKVVR